MQIDLPNLDAALKFLVGGGSSVVVMGALSYLVENWPKWHDLPKWLKLLLPMLASALLAVGAQVLMGYADVVAELSPWYVIIVTAVISWINSQKTYASTKVSGYGVHNPGVSIVEVVEYDTEEGVQ